jgi:hypothetical protein
LRLPAFEILHIIAILQKRCHLSDSFQHNDTVSSYLHDSAIDVNLQARLVAPSSRIRTVTDTVHGLEPSLTLTSIELSHKDIVRCFQPGY